MFCQVGDCAFFEVIGLLSMHSQSEIDAMLDALTEDIAKSMLRQKLRLEFLFSMTPVREDIPRLAWKARCFMKISEAEGGPRNKYNCTTINQSDNDFKLLIDRLSRKVVFREISVDEFEFSALQVKLAELIQSRPTTHIAHDKETSKVSSFQELLSDLRLPFPIALSFVVDVDHDKCESQIRKNRLLMKMKSVFFGKRYGTQAREDLLIDEAMSGIPLSCVSVQWHSLSKQHDNRLDHVMKIHGWSSFFSLKSSILNLRQLLSVLPLTHPGSTNRSSGIKMKTLEGIDYQYNPFMADYDLSNTVVVGDFNESIQSYRNLLDAGTFEKSTSDDITITFDSLLTNTYGRTVSFSPRSNVILNPFDFVYADWSGTDLLASLFNQIIFDEAVIPTSFSKGALNELIDAVCDHFRKHPKRYTRGSIELVDCAIEKEGIAPNNWLQISEDLRRYGYYNESILAMRLAVPSFHDLLNTLRASNSLKFKFSSMIVSNHERKTNLHTYLCEKFQEAMIELPNIMGVTNIELLDMGYTTIAVEIDAFKDKYYPSLAYLFALNWVDSHLKCSAMMDRKSRSLCLKGMDMLCTRDHVRDIIINPFRSSRKYGVACTAYYKKISSVPQDILYTANNLIILGPCPQQADELRKIDVSEHILKEFSAPISAIKSDAEHRVLIKHMTRGGYACQVLLFE